MKTWLFTWNPKRWPWNNLHQGYREMKNQIAQVGKAFGPWSCGTNKSIEPGDRIFLIRLGVEPRGLVASGYAATKVFEGPHWDPIRVVYGDRCRRIYVEFDKILDADTDTIVPIRYLKTRFPEVCWSSQCSGIEIPKSVSLELERIWKESV